MGAELIHDVHEGDRLLDVSIILPVYNEAGHLEKETIRVHESMSVSQYSYEIIVVDDGSTDGSGDMVENIDGIRLLLVEDHYTRLGQSVFVCQALLTSGIAIHTHVYGVDGVPACGQNREVLAHHGLGAAELAERNRSVL